MKMIKRSVSVFLCILLLIATCPSLLALAAEPGTTYYVNCLTGDDSSSGTSPLTAWKTVAKASEQTYSAGDSILFAAGGYYEGSFVAKGNGTAESPITLGAYGDIANEGKPALTVSGNATLIYIHNVSGWIVENLDISAPDGRGIIITANNCIMSDIIVRDCDFHNIWLYQTEFAQGYNAAFYIAADGLDTRIERLKIADCSIRDCAYGIHMGGNSIEFSPNSFISPEVSYSQDFIFENLTMNNLYYDGIVICSVNNLIVRNCSLINTCLKEDYYTAPLWMHASNRVLVENCEVAGSANRLDGMTVDFDGWSTNSTYQYIYSHDNVRFMQNCVYDNTTKNANCTVRYCLSVNDNREPNGNNLCNSPCYPDEDNPEYMDNFKFYNNTIVNGTDFKFYNLRNSFIANNIFAGELSQRFVMSAKLDIGLVAFSGKFTNNCFSGCSLPLFGAENSYNTRPLFAGKAYSKTNSFILSSSSELIGAGIIVEEDMGEHDFFGNPLTDTHNIGCYEGPGVDDRQTISNDLSLLINLMNIIGKLYGFYITIAYLF